MDLKEQTAYIETIFSDRNTLEDLQEKILKFEKEIGCFILKKYLVKTKQMVFHCDQKQCPFRIRFNKVCHQFFELHDFALSHNHNEVDQLHNHKCQLRLIENQQIMIQELYFEANINKETNQILFTRPSLILKDLQENHNFNLISSVDDPFERKQFKKKFDNIIQVLRRNFKKQNPHIKCIEDEFTSKMKASSSLICKSTKITSSSLVCKSGKRVSNRKQSEHFDFACSLSSTSLMSISSPKSSKSSSDLADFILDQNMNDSEKPNKDSSSSFKFLSEIQEESTKIIIENQIQEELGGSFEQKRSNNQILEFNQEPIFDQNPQDKENNTPSDFDSNELMTKRSFFNWILHNRCFS